MDDELKGYLEKIVGLLELMAKPSLPTKIYAGAATGVTIVGILSVIDIIKRWFGG